MRGVPLGLATVLVASALSGLGGETAHGKEPSVAGSEASVACGPGGIDVTLALSYERAHVGTVAATYLDLRFAEPLKLPDPATPERVRPRLTSLMAPEYHVTPAPKQTAGKLRVGLTTAEPGIPPGNALTIRFDCATGSRVRAGELSCSTDEVTDAAGQPMPASLAQKVRCVVVGLAPVGSPEATPPN